MQLFAPGKLFVFGEWSVLEAGNAILVPTPAGQRGALHFTDDALDFVYEAPEVAPAPARFTWTAAAWHRTDPAPDALDLLGATLAEATRRGLAPARAAHLTVTPHGLFDGAHKLGFGSSAAVCALVADALHRLSDRPHDPHAVFHLALDAHRRAQSGRGSGADVAVSCFARDLLYQLPEPVGLDPAPHLDPLHPTVQLATRPPDLHLLAAWTGNPADTRQLLTAVARLHHQRPYDYRRRLDAIAHTADRATLAWRRHDAPALVTLAAEATETLDALGRDARVPIVDLALRDIIDRVHHATHGRAAAKPSGAGGGDMALILTDHPGQAHDATRALERAGYRVIDLPALDNRPELRNTLPQHKGSP